MGEDKAKEHYKNTSFTKYCCVACSDTFKTVGHMCPKFWHAPRKMYKESITSKRLERMLGNKPQGDKWEIKQKIGALCFF